MAGVDEYVERIAASRRGVPDMHFVAGDVVAPSDRFAQRSGQDLVAVRMIRDDIRERVETLLESLDLATH